MSWIHIYNSKKIKPQTIYKKNMLYRHCGKPSLPLILYLGGEGNQDTDFVFMLCSLSKTKKQEENVYGYVKTRQSDEMRIWI